MSQAQKKKSIEPSEQSIPFRIVCCLLLLLAVAVGCLFGDSDVHALSLTSLQMTRLLISCTLTLAGSYFSYKMRNKPWRWLKPIIMVMISLVLLNFASELFAENVSAQDFQVLRPLLHVFMAACVLHSFELRTRSDINWSSAFALTLLILSAPCGKSLLFGAAIFLYVCLGSMLLYLDCQSRSYEGTNCQSEPGRESARTGLLAAFNLPVLAIPAISAALFLFVPRIDYLVDITTAQAHSAINRFMTAMAVKINPRAHGARPTDATLAAASIDKQSPDSAASKTAAAKIKNDFKRHREIGKASNPKANETKGSKGVTDKKGSSALPQESSHAAQSEKQDKQDKQGKPDSAKNGKANNKDNTNPKGPSKQSKTDKKDASEDNPESKTANQTKDNSKKPSGKKDSKESGSNKAKADSTASDTTGGTDKEKPAARQYKSADAFHTTAPTSYQPDHPNAVSLQDRFQAEDDIVFSVACNRTVYFRTYCFDQFDGHNWTVTSKEAKEFLSYYAGERMIGDAPALAIPENLPTLQLTQDYMVKADLGEYMPVAGIPQKIGYRGDALYVDIYGSVKTNRPLGDGASYRVVSQIPVYSIADMSEASGTETMDGLLGKQLDTYLSLPAKESDQVLELAQKVSGDDGNRFTKCMRMTEFLRKNYQYSLTAPLDDKSDNDADDFLLGTKSGDCRSFATGFVLMCRSLDIPARLVAGYVPGQFDPVSGTIVVRKKHAHAWAEAFIGGYGWVPFDPTPNGILPARSQEKSYNLASLKQELLRSLSSPGANATYKKIISILLLAIDWLLILGAAAISIFVLALVLPKAKALVAALLHRRRSPKHRAGKLLGRVMKNLHHLQIARMPADTATDISRKVRAAVKQKINTGELKDDALSATVDNFMVTYNAVYFGEKPQFDELESLAKQVKQLTKSSR
jgi:hypothetical protein